MIGEIPIPCDPTRRARATPTRHSPTLTPPPTTMFAVTASTARPATIVAKTTRASKTTTAAVKPTAAVLRADKVRVETDAMMINDDG